MYIATWTSENNSNIIYLSRQKLYVNNFINTKIIDDNVNIIYLIWITSDDKLNRIFLQKRWCTIRVNVSRSLMECIQYRCCFKIVVSIFSHFILHYWGKLFDGRSRLRCFSIAVHLTCIFTPAGPFKRVLWQSSLLLLPSLGSRNPFSSSTSYVLISACFKRSLNFLKRCPKINQ